MGSNLVRAWSDYIVSSPSDLCASLSGFYSSLFSVSSTADAAHGSFLILFVLLGLLFFILVYLKRLLLMFSPAPQLFLWVPLLLSTVLCWRLGRRWTVLFAPLISYLCLFISSSCLHCVLHDCEMCLFLLGV